MLLDSRSQVDGLRYLFAWIILENVKSSGAPEMTLLPPEISKCMSAMTGMRNDVKAQFSLSMITSHRDSMKVSVADKGICQAVRFFSPSGDR